MLSRIFAQHLDTYDLSSMHYMFMCYIINDPGKLTAPPMKIDNQNPVKEGER